MEVIIMKHSTIEEIRNAEGKLVAKWYPEKGVIETAAKGCYVQIIIPACTQISVKCSSAPIE